MRPTAIAIKVITSLSLILALDTGCFGKDWRGIVPLKSTRADVERLLGSPTQTSSFGSYYRLTDVLAMIWFQHQPCGDRAWGGGMARSDQHSYWYRRYLKENMMRGAIVVYGPNQAERASLIRRATRSRKHLETVGLEPQRILTLNGGYREDSGFELHHYGIGTFVSRIYLWPEKDPAKVKSETKK